MKFLKFTTRQEAEQRDYDEAHARGCEGVTEYWWGVVELTEGFGLPVGDDALQPGEVAIEATLKPIPENLQNA